MSQRMTKSTFRPVRPAKDTDHPVHQPITARVLVQPSLYSPEAVEGTCDQRRL